MPESYYDSEAHRYDSSRGGPARADAAAAAITRLLPPSARTVLDVAGGTGIVSDPTYHLASFTGTISLPNGMSETGMSLK